MCVDYRALNAITLNDRCPLPGIDDLLPELSWAKVPSHLDLMQCCHHNRVAEYGIGKTAFRGPDGFYKWTVMSFGMSNASVSTFQRQMDGVLSSFLRKLVVVYLDDRCVHISDKSEHLENPRQVFPLLSRHKLKLRVRKCLFGHT